MREGALKWTLRLIGILLMVGPFLVALGMHNWNIVEAVVPSQAEMSQVQNALTGILGGGFSSETITIENYNFDMTSISATVRFNSPFTVPVKISGFSGYLSCGDHPGTKLAQVSMQGGSVTIPENGSGTFTIVGQPTTEGIQHIIDSHLGSFPNNVSFENVSAGIEIYGLTITIQVSSMMQGVP